jgi:phosphoribosyl 1,2-cyclic phosphodiesterase
MPDSDNSPLLVQPAPGIELIFLGSGTSGSLPNVSCLTAPETATPCKTCLSTVRPDGKKNIRRNTSTVMRIEGKDGEMRSVLLL